MTYVKGNIRGAQHKRNGHVAKQARQDAAWARCSEHTFSVDGRVVKKLHNIMGEMVYQTNKRVKKCKSCGAPEPEKD